MRPCALLVVVFLMISVSGCSTEFNPATKRQESIMYGDDKESAIGASVALAVEKELHLNYEVDVNLRVEKILKRIVAVCERKDITYTIRVIDDEQMNAFSLPGGYIFINKGLIDRVKNDNQLASVIAHEVAHVTAKHAMKRLQGSYGATILQGAAIVSGSGALAAGAALTSNSLLFANSRQDEFEADKLGVVYMKKAGYDATQMRAMLGELLNYVAKQPARPMSYWRTHPFIPQRMAQADIAANGKSEFKDYLNITGEEK